MNCTYDLTNIFERLIEFGTNKDFGMNDDSANNPLKLKKKEYIGKDKNKYIIVKYDHEILSNDLRDKTGLFRSLIFKNGKLVVFSPPKSLMYDMFNEKLNEVKKENTDISFTAEEFIEGTMINLFYDNSIVNTDKGDDVEEGEEGEEQEQEQGDWEISTRSTIGAKISFFRDGSAGKTFRSMFLDAMIESGLEFSQLNKDYCYSFVLQHPDNRIVCPIVKPQLYLAAVYNIVQTESTIQIHQIHDEPEFISTTKVLLPRKLDNDSIDELKFKYASMNTPYDTMGFVIKENTTGIRCKFRNPGYEEVKTLRGNQPKLLYQYISLRQMGRVGTYLKYFPEHKVEFNTMRERIHNFTTTLHNSYVACFVMKEKPLKEYSAQFRSHMYKLHTFYLEQLRENNGKIDRAFVIQYVNALHPAQLMFSMNFNFRKQNVDFIKKERGELPENQEKETQSNTEPTEL